jgi:hypothetical protein
MGLDFIGDGLRDALDPKDRSMGLSLQARRNPW